MTGWLTRRDRVAVLGLRLSPLTLGHLFLLDDLDIDAVGELTLPQLRIVVMACSMPHAEARRTLFSWWLPIVASVWRYRTRKANGNKEFGEFIEWYNEQRSGPDVITSGSVSGDDYAAPMHISLLAIARNKFNMTREEAMNEPVRSLRQQIVALGESLGEIKPWTHKDERLKEMGKAFSKKMKEKENPWT